MRTGDLRSMNSSTQPMIFISSFSLWPTMTQLTLCPDLERKLAQEWPLTLTLSFSFNHNHWLKINPPRLPIPFFVHLLLFTFHVFSTFSFMFCLANKIESIHFRWPVLVILQSYCKLMRCIKATSQKFSNGKIISRSTTGRSTSLRGGLQLAS